ncbi:HAD family hydrolase [Phormidium yuhuli AB48]|uniref:HAD family hydrolase n=1 Tax=Phormidium yuhuli AB48 TaxID=2940671 RepID=A0ABY5AJM4_9CYAN|nr:HAD family hydrolase [Phormidium yuhuli]USR89384.1 HAD family hydrolase [Phormidium yuhuli AB48]
MNLSCGPKTFKNIRAIIFDKDGTLLDTQDFLRRLGIDRARQLDAQIPGVGESLLMAFGIEGDRLDPTYLLAVGSRQENLIAAAAYVAETGRSWAESLQAARTAFDESDRLFQDEDTSPLFVGSLEVLSHLADAGFKLGILSADTNARVHQFVQTCQLDDIIQVKLGVDDGPSKPDPRLFQQACTALGVRPEDAIMVGDSPLDIEMAQRAGAAGTIGICWHSQDHRHLSQADVTIEQLDQLQVVA